MVVVTERLVEDLAAIANYLSSHKIKLEEGRFHTLLHKEFVFDGEGSSSFLLPSHTDYLGVYAQFRSNQLRKSLTA